MPSEAEPTNGAATRSSGRWRPFERDAGAATSRDARDTRHACHARPSGDVSVRQRCIRADPPTPAEPAAAEPASADRPSRRHHVVDRLLGRGRDGQPADGRPRSRSPTTPRPPSGRASSSPATCAGRGRSSSSAPWPTSSSSSTATGCSATTRRSSPASPGSTAGGSWSIGQQKGADTDENIRRNFGMPHPEGYRKAMRADGARRAVRAAGRHVRRRAGRPSRRRSRRSAASPRRSPARSG